MVMVSAGDLLTLYMGLELQSLALYVVAAMRRVADMDEAVRLVEASEYGLGLTVFSRRNGRAIADRITSGNVAINGFVLHAVVPTLPLGGTK